MTDAAGGFRRIPLLGKALRSLLSKLLKNYLESVMTLFSTENCDRCSEQSCSMGLREASGNSNKIRKISPQNWKYQQVFPQQRKLKYLLLPCLLLLCVNLKLTELV